MSNSKQYSGFRRVSSICFRYLAAFTYLVLTACANNSTTLNIAKFSDNDLSQWQERVFNNNTTYTLIDDENENIKVLRAHSKQSASALYQQINVDLTKTPFLNWRWKISQTFDDIDEKNKIRR